MKKLTLFFLVFLLFACTTKQNVYVPEETRVYTFPWETWIDGARLDNMPHQSEFAKTADDMFRVGNFRDALQNYYLAATQPLPQIETETVKIKIASALLADDQAQRSLDQLSNFYRAGGTTVNYVRPEAATMFGYIYGRLGNFNQSLAWFSQALRSTKSAKVTAAAEEGIRLLMQRIPEQEFQAVTTDWANDPFISKFAEAEKSRRMNPSVAIASFFSNPRFWEEQVTYQPESDFDEIDHDAPRGKGIAVLLPLSGRYAQFGRSVKRGIEIALASEENLLYTFEDTQGSSERAAFLCQKVANSGRYSIILGPLLFGPSMAVADCVQQSNLKMIAFTKKSDFKTTNKVYRLGVTVESQVGSLVRTAVQKLNLNEIAVVYPADDSARKFLQSFRSELAKSNLKPAFEYSYYKNPLPDFSDLNEEIELYQPQAIFVIDDLDTAARINTAIGQENINKLKVLGPAEWSNLDLLKRSSSALDGVIFVSPFYTAQTGLSAKFSKSFNKIYSSKPDFLAAQGYDSAILSTFLINQIKAGRNWSGAINNFQRYHGLTGEILFTIGPRLKRNLKVVEYDNKGLNEIGYSNAPKFVYRGNTEIKPEVSNDQFTNQGNLNEQR